MRLPSATTSEIMITNAIAHIASNAGIHVRAARSSFLNSRSSCCVAPIDAMLRLLPAARGEVLRYTQWADPSGHSSVTFASVAYWRE